MSRSVPPAVLTIAGSDSSGGAGIQADLKTFAAFGVFGASVVTAITAQNTCGVSAVHGVPPDMIMAQIDAVLRDVPVRVIKIGMVGSRTVTEAIVAALDRYPALPMVVDPVLIATTGAALADDATPAALLKHLTPRAAVLTPNLDEAAVLTSRPLATSEPEMLAQGALLLARGAQAVVMKGGHLPGDVCVDLLMTSNRTWRFAGPRLASTNTHGTGCTLASAIAASLALGRSLESSVAHAKAYVTEAMRMGASRRLGAGRGPLWHAISPPPPILAD